MSDTELTPRQRRERDFYKEFSRRNSSDEVDLDPVMGDEKRPWNSYWAVYEKALQIYSRDKNRLLDFGCGNGESSVRYAKIGYEVWGFDVSPDQIENGRRLARKYKQQKKMHFSVQTAEKLDYPSDFFDVIMGIDILHHVVIADAVKECHRILKPGGKAVFREHVEVPVFDRLRNTVLVKKLVPNRPSLERHITPDEHKLTPGCLATIARIFPKMEIKTFTLLSRIDPFIRRATNNKPSLLEKADHALFQAFPFLRRLGGHVVLILEK